MLAELLGVGVSVIRRWQRRGWIVPVREVRRLAYFDFQEVATARRLTELLAAGMTPSAIEKKLAELSRYLPGVKRPLAQLSIIVEGKQLLLRQGDGLVEPGGQLRFDFSAATGAGVSLSSVTLESDILAFTRLEMRRPPRRKWCKWPASWRTTSNWPRRPRCIVRQWPPAAPRPRHAFCWRSCCIRCTTYRPPGSGTTWRWSGRGLCRGPGEPGLRAGRIGRTGVGGFRLRAALAYHDDYADVHYQMGRTLDALGRADEACAVLQVFLASSRRPVLGPTRHAAIGTLKSNRFRRFLLDSWIRQFRGPSA